MLIRLPLAFVAGPVLGYVLRVLTGPAQPAPSSAAAGAPVALHCDCACPAPSPPAQHDTPGPGGLPWLWVAAAAAVAGGAGFGLGACCALAGVAAYHWCRRPAVQRSTRLAGYRRLED